MESALLVGKRFNKTLNSLPFYVLTNNQVDQFFVEPMGDSYPYVDDIYIGQVLNSYKTYATINIGRSSPALIKKTGHLHLIEGQYLPIQIIREELSDMGAFQGTKGAKVSHHISIAGTFFGIHISPRSPEENTLNIEGIPSYLLELLSNYSVPVEQIFLRSNIKHILSDYKNWEELVKQDLNNLANQYKEIIDTLADKSKIKKIYQAPTPLQRYMRNLCPITPHKIYVQDNDLYHTLRIWLIQYRPDLVSFLKFVDTSSKNYFQHSDLSFFDEDDFLETLSKPIIPLEQGNIIIEITSVATTIDINSHHNDPLQVNSLAAHEIIKHIKWRQLGGRIIIDFIKPDFIKKDQWMLEQKKLEETIKNGLKHLKLPKDRKSFYWSPLGWLEILLPHFGSLLQTFLNQLSKA